jgi:hypothetical protein
MAAWTELYIDQGADFSYVINLSDDLTNANINVSNYIVRSQMRRSYYSANASANITCTISNADNGEITISMNANTTANIKAGRYLFDVETLDPLGVKSRVLEGIITVTPEITR